MRSNGLVVLALACGLAAVAGGCDAELVPHAPTFAADIGPLMISRCVRCHGGGGTLNDDPEQQGLIKGPPLYGYFDRLEDQGDCTAASGNGTDTCKRGLRYYAPTPGPLMTLKTYIHGKDANRMPPPPAPGLTEQQLQIMDNWLAESPPM
jgi:hypothetical protein